MLTHPNVLKALSPGRVVTVFTVAYGPALAVVLQQQTIKSGRSFTVLMLCRSGDEWEEKAAGIVGTVSAGPETVAPYKVLQSLFSPVGEVKHTVVTIDGKMVHNITEEVLAVEPKKIMDDYNNRQIPRFR